jgi:hypothetical protein
MKPAAAWHSDTALVGSRVVTALRPATDTSSSQLNMHTFDGISSSKKTDQP